MWKPETILIAMRSEPLPVPGYVYRHLGLRVESKASPKGRKPTRWSLTHLGTGMKLATMLGDVATVFPVATEIAEAGDWSFDGPLGWQNQFPDAKERVGEIAARYPKIVLSYGGRNSDGRAAHEVAREVAMRRAGLV